MVRLSAGGSMFWKYVFPFAMVPAVCGWVYWSDIRSGEEKPFYVYISVTLLMCLVAAWTFRRDYWKVADTADLIDDVLHVRRWKTEVRIPLSEIKAVEWERGILGVGFNVFVDLKQPCALGDTIRFLAPDPRKAPNVIRDLESFSARVEGLARSPER